MFILKINNDDGRCLFYALVATLMHTIAGWESWRFYDYMHNRRGQEGRLQQDAERLMKAINAPMDKKEYKAKDYVPAVIRKWNIDYAGSFRFKCFVFDALGSYEPLDKWGPDDYNTPIILYYVDNHFHGVAKASNLFGQPYCLSCESCYQRASDHKAECKARCMKW